ncbi:MAG: hypothetical protein ACYTHJ_07025 [Planctomycetota bacterium]|jgi:hypothetical protein
MKTRFLQGNLLIGTIAALSTSAVAQDELPTYALRYLGETSKIEGINASGVITGWRLSPSPARSFVVGVDQPYTLLPLPAGYISSLSTAINDAGVIVGNVMGGGSQKGAVWTPDGAGGYTIQLLDPLPDQMPPHVDSIASAINNRGDIVGVSINPGYSGGPTVWFNSPDGIVALGPDAPSPPSDVNDNGVVVGGLGRKFYLDTMTGTPIPPGFGAGVFAVNSHEDLAGVYGPTTETTAACRWTETFGWEQLGVSGDGSSGVSATDINDSHVTVGNFLSGSVYFDDFGLFWLNDLLLPEYANWGLDSNNAAINENGQIALFGWNSGLDIGGVVLLTPIGEMIIPGDVNGDAFVDLDDHCAWQASPIDLDGDGDVDAADEQWLIDRLADLGFIVADCNGNGAGDHCDIVDGFSEDCDENDMPDECQPDCSGDGLPDVCEPDCNTNGTPDPCDILDQSSQDCNANGIPDECDATGGSVEALNVFEPPIDLIPDNVIQDDLIVASAGTIEDVDFTLHLDYRIGYLGVQLSHGGTTITILDRPGVPAEGPLGNGQLGYDIVVDDEGTGGALEDVGNFGSPFDPIVSPPSYTPDDPLSIFDGMPSEGVWTVTVLTYNSSPTHTFHEWGLNISTGTAASTCDCNGNGVPDIDDIAAGTSPDCDGNAVPDECEIAAHDCNGNGTLDACDVLAGTSPDCNGNATPDECDVAVEDCNGNGFPDDCDVAGGTSADCDNNGAPDECDLVNFDCNNNGVVDGCDIASGASEDCNWNVVPDECEVNPDCNNDDCGDAIAICPGVGTGSTVSATPDGWATCVPVDNADVYYTYTPATSGTVTVTTCTSPYDTLISIHTGCPAESANTIACNDDMCGVNDSHINFEAEGGVTYLIRVSGWMWETGDFTLTLLGPECVAACALDADCDDQDPCTDDVCGVDGVCSHAHNAAACDDGDPCTTDDACNAGVCVGGPPACTGIGCEDCNENGQADECDIADGGSVDSNGDGIPDECDNLLPGAPVVEAEGSRYLAVTPAAGIGPVALIVSGDPLDPATACLVRFVQVDGTLGSQPVYRLPGEWGTVHVHGAELMPEALYEVMAEEDTTLLRSSSDTAATWVWGDVDDDGVANFADVLLIVLGFQGVYDQVTPQAVDIAPCATNGVVNFEDIQRGVNAFQQLAYPCGEPCTTGG